jgi:hypothetical protein
MKNELYATVTQYTHKRNNRPLKIENIKYAFGGEKWQVIDFGYVIFEGKTGLEVKEFLGGRPTLRGAFEVYHTPVGRSIEKQLYGVRVI